MSPESKSFSEHRIPSARGRIHVQDYAGAGDAFVLMHGFPDNRHIYDELVPHLVAGGRRVVTFDFLGFGDSEHPVGASYGFAQQLEDLKAVVGGLELGRIVPVGHDASGPAAINFALEQPDRVSSVCLLNCLYAAGPSIRIPELILLFATNGLQALSGAALEDTKQLAWLLRFQQRKFRDALPEHLRPHFDATIAKIIDDNFLGQGRSTAAFAQMTAELLPEVGRNTARLPELASLRTPFRLVWGAHDPYLGGGVANDLLPHLANGTLEVLPAGHWPQLDMPEAVARLLLA